jgi:hypothetical protein
MRNEMKHVTSILFAVLLIFIFLPTFGAYGEKVYFDKDEPNKTPKKWRIGVTGKGNPKWMVIKDSTAPSGPNVLYQSGEGTFPWCVIPRVSLIDGFVEVKFKPLSGKIDRAGGLIWRFKDGNQYYVARANALENNVSLYCVKKGKRRTIKYVDAQVIHNEWNTLRVDFAGDVIKVFLNGEKYIDLKDKNIFGAGAVGVWTKADSKTLFDDFIYE